MMHRAYSLLEVKAVKDDERIITGIATTPAPDRVGDVVEPKGIKFKNPLPLLWHHRADQPVGTVRFDKPTEEGVTFTAKLPQIDEPGPLKDRVDTAWGEVKAGLVRGVSIGFRDLEYSRIEGGGLRFIETEVLELSLVTIPANAEASIQTVKSVDAELLAATGTKQDGPTPPAPGKKSKPIVKAQEGRNMKKPVAETISAFKATRQLKADRMAELMDAANEKGETLDDAGQQEYDGIKDELKSIDAHLERLEEMQSLQVKHAVEPKGEKQEEASKTRSGVRVEVKGGNVPKGIGFVRLLAAKTNAYLSKGQFTPLQYAQGQKHWASETPEVEQILKAAVSAGTTTDSTWAAPLAQYTNLASEFVEYLRPQTIIGKIPGLRRVPFMVKFPRQTTAAVSNWVGQAKPKPVTSLAFDSLTLDPLKVAGIVPISMELMRFSSPSAEAIIRDDLAGSIAQLVDHDFIDPEKAAVSNVSPASITNGVSGVSATGTAYSNLKADVKSIMDSYFTANITPDTVIMHQRTALALSLMETSLGNPQFPGLTINGGTFLGMTAVVSNNIDDTEDSPQEGDLIVFLRASEIALADDGGVDVDVSTEASIEMSTTPTDPVSASTVLVSLWQQNLVGIRAERMVNWVKRRSAAVQYIKAAKYV